MSIQIKRGMKKDLPQLKDGELAFCRDTKELYVGNNGNENVSVTKKIEDRLDAVDSQLEHIENKREKGVKFIAHRGFSWCYPENTTLAFEGAGQKGVWGIECDIYCINDNEVVVLHDNTIDRTTSGSGSIYNFNFIELSNYMIDGGNNAMIYDYLKIPKLEEYLLICKKYNSVPLIEIKHRPINDTVLNNIKNVLIKTGMLDKAIFIAEGVIIYKTREIFKNNTIFYLGSPQNNFFEVGHEIGNVVMCYQYNQITKEDIELTHKVGFDVAIYTVNKNSILNELIENGADYIITDKFIGGIANA